MKFKNHFESIKTELQTPMPEYAQAKTQAIRIDQLMGYDCQKIEERLFVNKKTDTAFDSQQFWIGLDLQSLQTPYSEIAEMIDRLDPQPGQTWLDLGAGYGRMGVTLGFLRPQVNFIGYEVVAERVTEGQRIFDLWKLQWAQMKHVDIATEHFHIDAADLYFLYDFGSKNDVFIVLNKLAEIAKTRKIQVVARGRGVRHWIMMDFPWLSQIHEPEHFNNWSLFRS